MLSAAICHSYQPEEGRNAYFNDTLSTFYYGNIGIGHVVKNHIDSAATPWVNCFE